MELLLCSQSRASLEADGEAADGALPKRAIEYDDKGLREQLMSQEQRAKTSERTVSTEVSWTQTV